MKTTKRLLLFFAIVAMAFACTTDNAGSTTGPDIEQEPDPKPEPEPEPDPNIDTKYPTDSHPDKFEDFFKRTMVVDHTGTGCGYCPRITKSLNDIEKGAKADQIVIIAAHTYKTTDDPMYNNLAQQYKNACGVNSYPAVNLDLRKSSDATFSSGSAEVILSKCDALEKKYPAKVAIAAAVELVGTDFIIKTGVKVGVTGTYKMGITVLESGISAKQTNFGFSGYDFNIHNHAVRDGRPFTNVVGFPLTEGVINAGQLVSKDFTIPVPAKTKAENVSVVVYVSTTDVEGDTQFYINNSVVCKVGSPVAFKYKE